MFILLLCLQLFTIIGDIFVIALFAYGIYLAPLNPIMWMVVFIGLKVWYDVGGFEAWNLRQTIKFLKKRKEFSN